MQKLSGGDREYSIGTVTHTSPHFRHLSLELPLLSSNGRRRHFSSPAPQQEAQPISSLGIDGLQNDTRDVRENPPQAPKEVGDKSASKAAPKPDSSEEVKATKTATLEKKESTIVKKAKDATMWAIKALVSLLAKTPGVLWFYLTHPTEFRKKLVELKEMAVKEAHHYWLGSKVSLSCLC